MLENYLRINTVVEMMIKGVLQKTSWHKDKIGPWTEPYTVALTFPKWPRKMS